MPSPTLIAEATRRSGVVWLSVPPAPAALVWHVWHDGAAYVVGGGPEQALPVGPGDRALVVVRSKAAQAGVVVQWEADVAQVEPGSDQWAVVLPVLAAERLNAEPDRSARWASESVVLRLSPVDVTAGGSAR